MSGILITLVNQFLQVCRFIKVDYSILSVIIPNSLVWKPFGNWILVCTLFIVGVYDLFYYPFLVSTIKYFKLIKNQQTDE